jgi:hypothetical protein
VTHRGPAPEPAWHNWRDRSWKHRLAYDAVAVAALAAVFVTLFILGDLIVYGRVNW